jgi:hypothetical protein
LVTPLRSKNVRSIVSDPSHKILNIVYCRCSFCRAVFWENRQVEDTRSLLSV